jgi:hypothetical protein
MSVLAPHPVTSFEKDDPYIEQRRRLKEFSTKFSEYLPSFNIGVLTLETASPVPQGHLQGIQLHRSAFHCGS